MTNATSHHAAMSVPHRDAASGSARPGFCQAKPVWRLNGGPRQVRSPRRKWVFGSLVAIALAALPGVAAAQPAQPADRDWSLTLGAGAGLVPDYEGSDDWEIRPLPVIRADWRDTLFVDGLSAGVRTRFADDRVTVGAIARYDFGRDESDNGALRGLGDVDGSVELGGFVRGQVDIFTAGLTVVQDVAGGHDGLLAEGEIGIAVPVDRRIRLTAMASATYADDSYMQSLFGVDAAQAARSGYTAFDPSGGIKDVGLSAGGTYLVTDRISIGTRLSYTRLLGDAADSPIVDQAGSADQIAGILFVGYAF